MPPKLKKKLIKFLASESITLQPNQEAFVDDLYLALVKNKMLTIMSGKTTIFRLFDQFLDTL